MKLIFSRTVILFAWAVLVSQVFAFNCGSRIHFGRENFLPGTPSVLANLIRAPFRGETPVSLAERKVPHFALTLRWMRSELAERKKECKTDWLRTAFGALEREIDHEIHAGARYRKTLILGYQFARAMTARVGVPWQVRLTEADTLPLKVKRTKNYLEATNSEDILRVDDSILQKIDRAIALAPRFIFFPLPQKILDERKLHDFMGFAATNIIPVGLTTHLIYSLPRLRLHVEWFPAEFFVHDIEHGIIISNVQRTDEEVLAARQADRLAEALGQLPAPMRDRIEEGIFKQWQHYGFSIVYLPQAIAIIEDREWVRQLTAQLTTP